MKRAIAVIKSALLLGAAAVAGTSVVPNEVQGSGVFCEKAGYTCHIIVGDTSYHFRVAQ
jgi:hypothetical protein